MKTKMLILLLLISFSCSGIKILNTSPKDKDYLLEIYVGRGENWFQNNNIFTKTPPQFAVWAEDEKGNFIETFYLTQNYRNLELSKILPFYNSKKTDDYESFTGIDAVSEATPKESFKLISGMSDKFRFLKIYLEVNSPMDYNNYFTYQKYPDDGQPSLIYQCEIDLLSKNVFSNMKLLGFYSDGKIVNDLQKITSAGEIIEKIIIKIQEAK